MEIQHYMLLLKANVQMILKMTLKRIIMKVCCIKNAFSWLTQFGPGQSQYFLSMLEQWTSMIFDYRNIVMDRFTLDQTKETNSTIFLFHKWHSTLVPNKNTLLPKKTSHGKHLKLDGKFFPVNTSFFLGLHKGSLRKKLKSYL